jgi:hypothetical protein
MSVFRMIRTQSVYLRPEVWLPLVVGLALGASIVVVPPWLVLLGLVGLVGVVAGVNRPEFFLMAFVFIEATILSSNNPLLSVDVGVQVFITDLLFLLLFAVLVFRLLSEQDFKLVRTPLDLPLALFIVMVTAVTVFRLAQSSFDFLPYAIPHLRSMMYLGVFFAVTNLIRDKKQVHVLLNWLMILGAFVGLAMIAQAIVGESVRIIAGPVENLITGEVLYADVTRIRPPGRSTVLIVAMLASTAIIFEGITLKKTWRIGAAGLAGIGVLLTFWRSYWGALMISFSLLFFFLRPRKRLLFVLLGILVGVLLIAGVTFSGDTRIHDFVDASLYRFQTLLRVGEYNDISTLQWREVETAHAIASIKEHPFIGVGLGARYRRLDSRLDGEYYDGRRYIHNGHLWLITKTGVLSYLPFIGLSILFVIRGIRHWRQVDNPLESAALLSFSLSYVGVLAAAMAEAIFRQEFWIVIIGLMMGINEVIIRLNQNDASAEV